LFFLRNNEELLFDSLMNLSGVDNANGQSINDEEGVLPAVLCVYYIDQLYGQALS
jgi:hypothetical protein